MFENWKSAACGVVITISVALFASSAHAVAIYNEVPDAGHTFATAQSIDASIDMIQGNLASEPLDFGDLYWFQWGGGSFQADTGLGADFDTELFLWNHDQVLLVRNDDANLGQANCGSLSVLCSLVEDDLDPGHYYLGIGFNDTFAGANGISLEEDFGLTPPGAYTIRLNAFTEIKNDIPEPATLALFAIGLAGFGVIMRRRRRKTGET